jgi:hypothetical protein
MSQYYDYKADLFFRLSLNNFLCLNTVYWRCGSVETGRERSRSTSSRCSWLVSGVITLRRL